MTPALIPATKSPRCKAPRIAGKPECLDRLSNRPQRLTAGQTAPGVSQLHLRCESRTQGEEPPKKRGFGALISEGGGRDIYMVMPV